MSLDLLVSSASEQLLVTAAVSLDSVGLDVFGSDADQSWPACIPSLNYAGCVITSCVEFSFSSLSIMALQLVALLDKDLLKQQST